MDPIAALLRKPRVLFGGCAVDTDPRPVRLPSRPLAHGGKCCLFFSTSECAVGLFHASVAVEMPSETASLRSITQNFVASSGSPLSSAFRLTSARRAAIHFIELHALVALALALPFNLTASLAHIQQ